MKKVLYVITKSNWGGAQRYVFDLAVASKAAGFDVAVAYGGQGELSVKLDKAGIRGIWVPTLGRDVSLADLAAYRALRRLFKDERPAVVHLNSSKVGVLGAIAARISAVPRIVFTAHGWAFNEARPLWQRAAIWLLHYLTVALCNITIAVSQAIVRDARHMYGTRKKIVLVYNGIHEPDFLPRDDARVALAARLPTGTALSADSTWVGTLAELNWNKGLHVLVRAAGELARRGLDFVVVVMGEGQERRFLETLIEEERVADRVFLVGHVEEGSRYLKALDIFTLPSRTEALAYAVIEAGFASLPVVASRVGGVPEVVGDKVSGLLVGRDNHHTLANALGELINSPTERARLGRALRERVETHFSVDEMHTRTLALYR